MTVAATQSNRLFLAAIKERYCLNPGSVKETYHIVIDLEGSGIEYSVGDCIGIYPQNSPILVESLLGKFQATGQETVLDRQGISHLLEDFLLHKANLMRLPDAIEAGSHFNLCAKLPPMLPRYYSIASSMQVVGNEVHLTVGLINGTCSDYLCRRAFIKQPLLPIFHHPARSFSLPEESKTKPIIMIGPGTGVAPFRGFLQERMATKAAGKNWLFFGEKNLRTDFYYQSFWHDLVLDGKLELDCAFSRDQEEKIYVQHKMLKKSRKLWSWLQEGAYLYVCGDASRMAKDVDKTLLSIVEAEGGFSTAEAKQFIKDLKHAGRYQRDVY